MKIAKDFVGLPPFLLTEASFMSSERNKTMVEENYKFDTKNNLEKDAITNGITNGLQQWLDDHIILNKRFFEEARRFKIKPGTNDFIVYHQHRVYEEFGKYGFCVAGINRIAEDCYLTTKQVLNAYNHLMNKGAIHHVWCDSKVYRNKTKVYVSQALIEQRNLVVNEEHLARTNRQKLTDGDTPFSLDQSRLRDYQSRLRDYQSRKSDYQSRESDLNNYNKQLKQIYIQHKHFEDNSAVGESSSAGSANASPAEPPTGGSSNYIEPTCEEDPQDESGIHSSSVGMVKRRTSENSNALRSGKEGDSSSVGEAKRKTSENSNALPFNSDTTYVDVGKSEREKARRQQQAELSDICLAVAKEFGDERMASNADLRRKISHLIDRGFSRREILLVAHNWHDMRNNNGIPFGLGIFKDTMFDCLLTKKPESKKILSGGILWG